MSRGSRAGRKHLEPDLVGSVNLSRAPIEHQPSGWGSRGSEGNPVSPFTLRCEYFDYALWGKSKTESLP